ncbi:hypothetical protein EB796_014730 [Bugula neritina]|uniref:Uncharacterized protein n=1 Tax=Bugula neritina TaxID=10212 RepID=A0A7J7JM61_BUGNE|nr:hypothetical protein EB796_014730 [Bugula neritina]
MASRKHAIQCNVDNTGLSVDQVAKLLEVDDLSKAPHCHLTLRLSIFKLMPTLINLRVSALVIMPVLKVFYRAQPEPTLSTNWNHLSTLVILPEKVIYLFCRLVP